MAASVKNQSAFNMSPEKYIKTKARSLSVFECIIDNNWNEAGIAQVVVARKHSNGNITAGFYLVDLYCLGVKDSTFIFNNTEVEYNAMLNEYFPRKTRSSISYALAHNIIYAAIEFADSFGFKPEKTFTEVTQYILEEDTDEVELIDVECGYNGKPLFIKGPFDDKIKTNRIINQLEQTAGPNNYYVVLEEGDLPAKNGFEGEKLNKLVNEFTELMGKYPDFSDEEHERFNEILDEFIDEISDPDIYNAFFLEMIPQCDFEEPDSTPDYFIGGEDVDSMDMEKLRELLKHFFQESNPDKTVLLNEMKSLPENVRNTPFAKYVELISMMNDNEKYTETLDKYYQQHPDFTPIRFRWLNNQFVVTDKLYHLPENHFHAETFFDGREFIHPIEFIEYVNYCFFFMLSEEDINRLVAFEFMIDELDLEEGMYDQFLSKINEAKILFILKTANII
ncbi:MAG: hypothetical protein Q7V19_17090 [Bacteroidales bacterium]|nr:hypothetical protein [Bacteroidales bacterium]